MIAITSSGKLPLKYVVMNYSIVPMLSIFNRLPVVAGYFDDEIDALSLLSVEKLIGGSSETSRFASEAPPEVCL